LVIVVAVRVRVGLSRSVSMPVGVLQAGLPEQIGAPKHGRRRSLCDEPAGLKHEAMVGNILNAIQIVRGGDDGAAGVLPAGQ
jgi:hypothetical protein